MEAFRGKQPYERATPLEESVEKFLREAEIKRIQNSLYEKITRDCFSSKGRVISTNIVPTHVDYDSVIEILENTREEIKVVWPIPTIQIVP